MYRNQNAAAAWLPERVMSGYERWGWEFQPLPAPTGHPDANRPPVWVEPHLPALSQRKSVQHAPLAIAAYIGLGILCLPLLLFALLSGVGLVALLAVPVVVLAIRKNKSSEVKLALTERERQIRAYEAARQRWQAEVDQFARSEQEHLSRLSTWFPICFTSRPGRIDVFGGTGHGWATLLTTACGPMLAAGHAVLVVDLTQQAVALELAGLAESRGVPVDRVPLPGSFADSDLREDLSVEELAESLAAAIATTRTQQADHDLQVIHADVLQTAAGHLQGPVTFTRLAAALHILLRTDTAAQDGDVLSSEEIDLLTQTIDRWSGSERVQNEMRYVCGLMELLAKSPRPQRSSRVPLTQWWKPGQLTVVSTDDLVDRRKDLTDRVLFFRLLHMMRRGQFQHVPGTVVLAGADHLGRAALETMARQARTAGVRLLLLLEHFREETIQVAGGSDSATIFMRMGNGEQAKAAAEFIGREHRFVVNQLTRQIGMSLSEGRGSSYGEQQGKTSSTGSSTSPQPSGSRAASTSSTWSTSLSRSWQETVNVSQTTSENWSESLSRIYEFAVEPTQLQSLPPTGLVLVESSAGSRRVVFGDCNPGIAGLPRVSAEPRPERR